MSIFESIILGILQGIAEFLPISSSGHLQIAQKLFGLSDVPVLFDVFLHLATLVAVCLYFYRQIWDLLCAFGRMIARRPAPKTEGLSDEECNLREKSRRRYILAIILTTIVTGVIGVINSSFIEDLSIKFVCAGFIVTAVLLVISSLIEKSRALKTQEACKNNTAEASYNKVPSVMQSLIIGVAQGCGTLPGISRSGATIAGSLFCGVDRGTAGEFSFIVSIPAILGAFILELKDIGQVASNIGAECVIAGCAAACFAGYLSLTFLMKMIKKGNLQWFALYLLPLGILGLIFF